MINKKVIVGILAILVLFTTVQGIKPVFADDGDGRLGGYSTWYVSVNGHGKLCWSGAATGCTESAKTLYLVSNMPITLTFTATPSSGFQFVDWSAGSVLTMNPYTVTANGNDQYISANFAAILGQ